MYISESEIAVELLAQMQDGGQYQWLVDKNEMNGLKGFGGNSEDLTKMQIANLANDIYRSFNQWLELLKLDPMKDAYLHNVQVKTLVKELLPSIDQMIQENTVKLNQRFNDWYFKIRCALSFMEREIRGNWK